MPKCLKFLLGLWETLWLLGRNANRGSNRGQGEGVFLVVVSLKERIFRWRLARLDSPERERRAMSLSRATSVGLVYLERDHAHFREVKEIGKMLKEKFGVKRVGFLSFVEEDEKNTPNWLVKKLGSGYFCKSDLNWHGWPVKEFEAFTDTSFDILIDLELEPILPLKFVIRKSNAGMKVGVDGTEWCEDLDFRIVPEPASKEDDLEEVDLILKDPMEEWKAHTTKTLEYLSKIDFQ